MPAREYLGISCKSKRVSPNPQSLPRELFEVRKPEGAITATSISGIVAAFLASLCCIGPLTFAALGVSVGATGFWANTAGFLKALLPYRPWFIGLTILLLGLSFYVAYRNPRAGVPSCQTCDPDSGSHPNRVLLWIIAALALALVLAPYWLGL